jgi:elongation factor P
VKQASDVRTGDVLLINDEIFKVEETEAKGAAKTHKTIHLKMRNILTGKHMEHTYQQEDKLEQADVTHKKALYSYKDSDTCCFLDEETYETYAVDEKIIGEKRVFLKENEKYIVVLYEERPIDLIFPERITLRVSTSPPPIKQHDAATYKKITLENGMTVDAPQFIEESDIVEIDTGTGKYIDRVQE